jgi:DNA-binding CsgD family transcriptional regulator
VTVAIEELLDSFREAVEEPAPDDAATGRLFGRIAASLAGFDEIVIFGYVPDRAPIHLFSTFSPRDFRIFVRDYQAGPYILDPFCQAALERRSGLFRMRQLAPDRFYSSEYFRSYYTTTNLAEELGFFVPLPGKATVVLSLMRRQASGKFPAGELALLTSAAPLVASLVRRSWSYIANRFDGTLATAVAEAAPMTEGSGWRRLNLTPRETGIVEMVLRGHSSESIALRLGISTGTVKVHRRNVYRKLGISSQTQLLSVYLDHFADTQQG